MNMSYCQFENTMNDLRQCVQSMEEADTMRDMDLSKSETRSFEYMRELCQNFLDEAGRLEQADEDSDGQPDEAQEWESFDADC